MKYVIPFYPMPLLRLLLCPAMVLLGAHPTGWYPIQGTDQTLLRIEEALREGDAVRLSAFIAPQVEIHLRSTSRVYSNLQARYVLQEFFQNNPPRTFTLLHKGRSEDMIYAIGSYVSSQGRWDVSLFTRFQNGKYLIEQLRFEVVED
ncbi:MAG: DUF4783 domain-containing protein [Bacteroidia bacterium]|nr:DUF4783 domain-containing protein [Bacteroidia bacterium]